MDYRSGIPRRTAKTRGHTERILKFIPVMKPTIVVMMPSDALTRSVCQWEPHLKAGITRLGDNLNVPPMLLHDSLHCIQAETGTLSDSFGSEEWFKDVRLYVGWNAGAVVSDLDNGAAVLTISPDS